MSDTYNEFVVYFDSQENELDLGITTIQDIVTPTARVEKVGSTATIYLTDVNGASQASISDGAQGPKGDTGEQGPQGPAGQDGQDGRDGQDGAAAGFGAPTITVDASTGTPYATIVASGPDTAKVFAFDFHNLKGEKGDKGDQGERGPQGPSGSQGPQGEQGDPGEQGEKGDKGDTGETGQTGPQGETGPRGEQGEQGPQGEQGEQGEKGETGATGAQGPSGPQGQQGEPGVTTWAGLQGKPTTIEGFGITDAYTKSEVDNALLGKQDVINDLGSIRSGSAAGATALQHEDVIDNLVTTSTNLPLSANMGKNLQDQIVNLQGIGRFLSIWDAAVGAPTSEPTVSPYQYKVGDYYRVGVTGTRNPANLSTYTTGGVNWITGDKLTAGDVIYVSTISGSSATWVKQQSSGGGVVQDVQVKGSSVLNANIANITSIPSDIVTLNQDLYTYAPIGVLQTEGGLPISYTNPKKVADRGQNLETVFTAVFGQAQDANPTINQNGTTFTKSAQTGTTSVSGAEIGQSIAAQTGTVTYTVTNTATCSYGVATANHDTYSKTTATVFTYPIKQRTINSSTYEVRIKYPELNGCTLSVTTGTLVFDDTANRYLYVNTANKQIVVSIAIPAGTSTAAAQTRFNQLEADVEFDNAQYDGENVVNFWTYLKNSYTASGMSHGAITGVKSIAYTITAGTRYAYSKVTNATTAPTSGLTKQSAESTFGTNGADFTYSVGDYIYLYRTSGGKTVYTYVLGQWAAVTFTELAPVTITQANGATCTYYPYQVGPMEASGSAKYRV